MDFHTLLRTLFLAAWTVAGVSAHARLRLQAEKAAELKRQPGATDQPERQQRLPGATVQPEHQHRLRVCNAYPYMTSLSVFLEKESGINKITDPPMAYKTCREFDSQLHAGDRIDFRFQDSSAGTFVVGELPKTDAVLMLVIYRHNAKSTQVAFESHVFANLLNAQIAVLDTYKGRENSTINIQDAEDATTSRSEPLAPNSVVALNPGKYEVVLVGTDGISKSRSDLTVVNRESCVVIRCGIQPEQGRAYPQELMVYPINPPSKDARSAARSRSTLATAALLGLLAGPFIVGLP
jgi:hypothetical protein